MIDDPPDAALTQEMVSSQYAVKVLINPWTCMASSLVGTKITARVAWYSVDVSPTAYSISSDSFRETGPIRRWGQRTSFASRTFCTAGIAYAPVFPLPVLARARTSLPSSSRGIALA